MFQRFPEIFRNVVSGGDSLIKVGMDVRRVQNLGGEKFSKKPNARAKFTSQNLMPGQKLTPEIPNARARTSVPTVIRESLPPR